MGTKQKIERFLMPRRADGKLPPNPWRYHCGYGHWHPSRKHALKCRERNQQIVDTSNQESRVGPMNRAATIAQLASLCTDVSVAELTKLSDAQLDVIDAVDTNWCYDADQRYGRTEAECISSAIYSMYEYVISSRFRK